MKILVLGGGGFMGSHLCDALLHAGHQVRVFEYPGIKPLISPELMTSLEWIQGDFTNPAQVDMALQNCDVIYHLVSTTLPKSSNENPSYDIQSNVVSTLNLLESIRRHGIRKIIFLSSGGAIYGIPKEIPIKETHPTDPITSYGIGKLTIEKYLHLYKTLYGIDYCVLRLANPFGERQRVNTSQGAIAVFLHKALLGEEVEIWGDGSVTRDYIYIADVISAMMRALDYFGDTHVFNVGSGVGLSLNRVLNEIEVILGKPVSYVYLPARKFDVPINVLDIERSKTLLHWQPRISFSEGILRTLNWMSQ
jgi:UDP-glucose 4-epimerase